MKQSPLYQRYAFIVLCPAILLMALRLFQRVNRPTAALPLTPTKSLVSNITATTAVSLPQSPLVLPNKAKPIALSTAILALLPAGAEPLAEFDASRLSGCGQETQAISYRLATGGISLAAIGRGKLLWDWQQEHAASKQ